MELRPQEQASDEKQVHIGNSVLYSVVRFRSREIGTIDYSGKSPSTDRMGMVDG